VPLPKRDGEPLPDAELVDWVRQLLDAVFTVEPAPAAKESAPKA
jgi:transcription-repair coupling factor (superfamily II helicase)